MLVGTMAFAPKADAGQYVKVWNGHCHTYVHKSQAYGSNWNCAPRYRSTYHRPARVYYSQPARYYRSNNYCERPVRYHNVSRPRFAISFGF